MIERLPELDAFVAAFGEWVEACWFAEHDRAPGRLEAVLAFPPDVVLVGALWVLRRLLELSDPRGLARCDPNHIFQGEVVARRETDVHPGRRRFDDVRRYRAELCISAEAWQDAARSSPRRLPAGRADGKISRRPCH